MPRQCDFVNVIARDAGGKFGAKLMGHFGLLLYLSLFPLLPKPATRRLYDFRGLVLCAEAVGICEMSVLTTSIEHLRQYVANSHDCEIARIL